MAKKFDYELMRKVFEDMGVEWNPNATQVLVDGKPLTKDFSIENLFNKSYEKEFDGDR